MSGAANKIAAPLFAGTGGRLTEAAGAGKRLRRIENGIVTVWVTIPFVLQVPMKTRQVDQRMVAMFSAWSPILSRLVSISRYSMPFFAEHFLFFKRST